MNAKITFVELVQLMAEATSTSTRVCELFLKDLFATISQALIDGESVKVKGLGTFKITQVKPRKSVNVNTGKTMTISGYSKVTFTPDKALADAVNQPFAQFESVFLDDAVTDEKLAEIDKQHPSTIGDQPVAADIEEPQVAEDAAPVQEVKPEPEKMPEPEVIVAEPPVEESVSPEVEIPAAPLPFELPEMTEAAPAPDPDALFDLPLESDINPVETGGIQAKPEKPAEVKPKSTEPAKAQPVPDKPAVAEKPKLERKPMLVGRPIDGPSQPIPEPEQPEEVNPNRHFYRPEPRNAYTPTPEQIEEATRKQDKDRRWLWLLLGLLGAALLFWAIARGCSDSNAEQHEKEVVAADTIAESIDSVTTAKPEAKAETKAEPKPEVKDEVKAEPKPEPKAEPKVEEKKPEPKAEAKPADKPSAKGEVTDVVTSQIVLTTLSEKHYGSPWFWVYIYEENVARGIINDPNNIKPGTRVVIPPASKYGINPNDKASLKKAQIKSMEYLKGR